MLHTRRNILPDVCYSCYCHLDRWILDDTARLHTPEVGIIVQELGAIKCVRALLPRNTIDPFQSRDQFLLVRHFDGQKGRACRRVEIAASIFKTDSKTGIVVGVSVS